MIHIDLSRPRSAVGRTVLVGMAAGLVAAVYFSVAGEPAIDDAIAIEEAMTAAEGDAHDHDQVSRGVQRGAGLFAAYAAFGAVFGLLLAVTALSLRMDRPTPFRRFVTAGTVLAVAIAVVPWFKYPPNPPAVGDEATVGDRQVTYWLLVVLATVVLVGAAHLSGRLRRAGWQDPVRIAAVAAVSVAAVGLLMVIMPAADVVIPAEMPASLIWRFRTASLLGNLLLWGSLTLAAATLASPAPRSTAEPDLAPDGAGVASATAHDG